ncbi:MAG TPA: alkaline phosphatase family protein [Bryobacteraceae bacterium]|nr:alkaline phosphatase family protein [Bryobacteraceae bacterium]
MAAPSAINHVFVLMLENRSFDHMLGFSGLQGADAETGVPTEINGLTGNESNQYKGQGYRVSRGADLRMPSDPNHEFPDVLVQLCGAGAQYPAGGAYPPIDNSGYVVSYVASNGKDPAEIMKCYTPGQLPVLNALASEFVVCDRWHASLPGPTWPNRLFAHAASSAGLDHSPTTAEILEWETVDGFGFPNGTIFDALSKKGIRRELYGGDDFPMVSALKGIHLDDIRSYQLFANDLAQPGYAAGYTFIEPSYDVLNDYRNGTSQHPLGDVTLGEALIKSSYEAIRNSPVWSSSLLIITWDEHGGFFEHALPPAAPPPEDNPVPSRNKFGFTFARYGPRVPALVISPLIPGNLIDHRLYDHASIPATLEALFGLAPLTGRDRQASTLDVLATLTQARTDCPETLPAPAGSELTAAPDGITTAVRPDDSVNQGNVPVIVHAAMQQDLQLNPDARQAIIQRVRSIRTRADAQRYLKDVQAEKQERRRASSSPPAVNPSAARQSPTG